MGKSILTTAQMKLLNALSEVPLVFNNFYLTGGTALSEYYLHHRYSADLDFFSETEVDARSVYIALQGIKYKIGMKKIDFERSFNRNIYILRLKTDIIKTEFTFFPFQRIERGKKVGRLYIDSLLDIAVNKLFTIYQNPVRARDFIDLYVVLNDKKWNLTDIISKAQSKFDLYVDPLQLGAQFLRVKGVKDLPRMITKVPMSKLVGFFVDAAKKMEGNILI